MTSHSKVSEALRRQAVQVKSGAVSLSAIGGCDGRSKSATSIIWYWIITPTDSTQRRRPDVTQVRGRIASSKDCRCVTASTQLLEYIDKSALIWIGRCPAIQCLDVLVMSDWKPSPAKPLISKTHKVARLVFTEEPVTSN